MIPSVAEEHYATSLKDWESYLGGLGILANPFSRSQWRTNRSSLLRAVGFSDTGATMKFTISDKIRSDLTDLVSTPHHNIGADKGHTVVAVISSLPGGGKTRLLLELLELFPDFDALYYITFYHTSPLSASFDTRKISSMQRNPLPCVYSIRQFQ